VPLPLAAHTLHLWRPSLEIHIRSPQASYVNGEKLRVEVAMRNSGTASLTVPLLDDPFSAQPFFVVRGPSYPNPFRFHWGGRAPTSGQAPIEVTTVAAGETLTETLTLPASLQFPASGVHELFATYEHNGTVVESNHIDVKVTEAGPPVFRFVGRTTPASLLDIQALSISGSALFLASFSEKRPDLGETAFQGLSRIGAVDAGATDFFAPWCQSAEPGVNGPRFGWRNGNTLTVAGFRKLPQRIALPFTPRIHGPSIMYASGVIERLVTDEAGTRLALIRFPAVGYDETPAPATVVWDRPMHEPIIDLAMSINPAGAHVAVLRGRHAVQLITWDDRGPSTTAPVPLEGNAVGTVAPAVHLSAAGIARATVLTTAPGNARRIVLTEIVWRPGSDPVAQPAANLELTSAVRSGTVAYSMSAIESPRREWFFVLESRRVQTSRSDGKARIFKREVLQPPHLLVMSELTYYLEVHRKPALVLID
jgi:hypothetical protein